MAEGQRTENGEQIGETAWWIANTIKEETSCNYTDNMQLVLFVNG